MFMFEHVFVEYKGVALCGGNVEVVPQRSDLSAL